MFTVLCFAALLAVAASKDVYTFTLGEAVDLTIGHNEAQYCILQDPGHSSFHEGFGPCRIRLDRVTEKHAGDWEAQILYKHSITSEKSTFEIRVEPRPEVLTEVLRGEDYIILHCKVKSHLELRICKLRSATNRLFLLGFPIYDSIEEGRYKDVSYEFVEDQSIHCGLRINNPVEDDFGFWRCGLEAADLNNRTYTSYGFLNSNNNDTLDGFPIITQPTLKARSSIVKAVASESFTMSCRIDAHLDYCFFMDPQGKIYNVESGVSRADYEYVGEGLESGECGMRMHSTDMSHSGSWSCNVGVNNLPQNTAIQVQVQGLDVFYMAETTVLISAALSQFTNGNVTMCRFVSGSGRVFTQNTVEIGYIVLLHNNQCTLTVDHPTALDLQPWLVGMRVDGYSNEFIHCTSRSVVEEPPTTPRPPSSGNSGWSFYFIWRMFFGLLILGFMLTLIGLLLSDTKRKWNTRRNATANTTATSNNGQVPSNNIVTIENNTYPYLPPNNDPRLIDEKQNLP